MINNPFTPSCLVSREAELKQISQILLQDGDFLLVGAPGTGRRTLLREAAQITNARMLEIDCLRSTNANQFLQLLGHSITFQFSTPDEIGLLQSWSINHPVTLELAADGKAQITWHMPPGKEWPLFESLLMLPQFMSEQLDCRVVIVFQNFPHIRSWDRQGKWETHLRLEIQRHSRVSYALVATVAEPWVYASNLEVIHLLPLSNDAMQQWLVRAMATEGLQFNPEDGAIALFLSHVQGHLGDAIALARRIWLDYKAYGYADNIICVHHIHRSMLALIDDMAITFEALVMLLPPSQVRVLESLALDPTESPQSREYIKKHQLSRGGGLQGALNSLEQKGLIYGPKFGYQVALPLFNFWLRQRLL
ncbi:MAG: AAA family ATPase [Leptolyngbyaceae bacterium]|nr:AAA family ATPase [Leptolyngbyaceae bacterium]